MPADARKSHSDAKQLAKEKPRIDDALITAARDGDRQALESLLHRCYPLVRGYLTLLTHDPELAADLAQETLLLASRRLSQLSSANAFNSWLHRIARNTYADNCRRRSKLQLISLEILNERRRADRSLVDQSTLLEQWAENDLVRDALEQLSVTDREVLNLRHVAGFSGNDLALMLNISRMTAYQRIHRAEQAFRRYYRILSVSPGSSPISEMQRDESSSV